MSNNNKKKQDKQNKLKEIFEIFKSKDNNEIVRNLRKLNHKPTMKMSHS